MPSTQTVRINIKNPSTAKYLKIFQGVTGLTQAETTVLAAFIDEHLKFPELDPFSVEIKKRVATALGYSSFYHLNSYLVKLKKKEVLYSSNDRWYIKEQFYPVYEEVIFVIHGPSQD